MRSISHHFKNKNNMRHYGQSPEKNVGWPPTYSRNSHNNNNYKSAQPISEDS